MSVITTGMDIPDNCGSCPICIYTADEKKAIGYCNTSDEDYYCKTLERFMEYDEVDGGQDILGKPFDCPLKPVEGLIEKIDDAKPPYNRILDTLEEKRFEVGMIAGLDKAIENIKEYCEVEE